MGVCIAPDFSFRARPLMSTGALGLREESSYLPAVHSPVFRTTFVLHVRGITRTRSTLVGFSLVRRQEWLCDALYTMHCARYVSPPRSLRILTNRP
ncbi:hypothetical protein SCP_0805540 [Sparassis crispa]|uniref:Uncharacterized protein n=1 Tax=Sparassis crispa TaxID=139825 RepID=A0A401GV16_9APHY|nr:hypothetical protein SCP_0805540 [Sparassis crispa]GBE86030.1 hypothetical protein SCP_0805540 [Sparassis crispa]